MKRSITTLSLVALFVLPGLAQRATDISGYGIIPIVTATLPTKDLPEKITDAVNMRFDKDNPLTWSKFPFEFKEYGWVYEVGSSGSGQELEGFHVAMETTKGNIYEAFYDVDGNLTETRERSRNIAIPRYVLEALAQTSFREWYITGDREMISYFRGTGDKPSAQQVFKLMLKKDESRKRLTFRYTAGSGRYQAYVDGKNIFE